MAPIFRSRNLAEWCEMLHEQGVPHSPAYDSNEALDDPQARHLKIKVEAVHPTMGPFTTVRAPYSFDGQSAGSVLPPPTLDEHGAEIRAELAGRRNMS
jgi:crotonobetainyl-CoA:carnitine CoA-transferase CaiB-like acyl-CoA transferase